MAYRVAAVDVHKKMLAVVVADVAVEGEYEFERRKFGATPDQLRLMAEWLLNQAAHAAIKVKGSIFEVTFRRLLPRLGYKQAIGAIAHRLCRVLWLILHQGVRYQERGLEVSAKSKRTRTARMIRELQKLGYRVEGGLLPAANRA